MVDIDSRIPAVINFTGVSLFNFSNLSSEKQEEFKFAYLFLFLVTIFFICLIICLLIPVCHDYTSGEAFKRRNNISQCYNELPLAQEVELITTNKPIKKVYAII